MAKSKFQRTLAVLRARRAQHDKREKRMARAMKRELREEIREFAAAILLGAQSVSDSLVTKWFERVLAINRTHAYPAVEAGYQLEKRAWHTAKAEPPTSALYDIARGADFEFLQFGKPQAVEAWLTRSSHLETRSTRGMFDGLFRDATSYWDETLERGLTTPEIAKRIIKVGLAEVGRTNPEARSVLMARTTMVWSLNEGAEQRYSAMGVRKKEWMATEDELTCEFCAGLDGKQIAIDEEFPGDAPFAITHPPLHPHCRCGIIPVFGENEEAA